MRHLKLWTWLRTELWRTQARIKTDRREARIRDVDLQRKWMSISYWTYLDLYSLCILDWDFPQNFSFFTIFVVLNNITQNVQFRIFPGKTGFKLPVSSVEQDILFNETRYNKKHMQINSNGLNHIYVYVYQIHTILWLYVDPLKNYVKKNLVGTYPTWSWQG